MTAEIERGARRAEAREKLARQEVAEEMNLDPRIRREIETIYEEVEGQTREIAALVPIRTYEDLDERAVRVIAVHDQARKTIRDLLGADKAEEYFAAHLVTINRLAHADPEEDP